MAAFEKFNPVNFSKNITKTIADVESKIGKVAAVPKSLTNELNAKTGLNIAVPPLPQINANVRGLVGSVKTLVKNPNGVVKGGITAVSGAANARIKEIAVNTLGNRVVGTIQGGVSNAGGTLGGFAKASFGVASAAVKSGLGQIKGTLRLGIKNCLRSATSSLLNNITVPNIPFGGITPNITNGISINGVISSVGTAGYIEINKKINKHLSAEITLLGTLDKKKASITGSITGRLNILKEVKNTNFYTAKLTSEVNKNINNICNTLSPRNKKKLSKGGPIVEMVANAATDNVINNIENQIIKSASGFSAKSPNEFFNAVTGLPKTAANKVTSTASTIATAAKDAASNVVTNTTSRTAQAYNKIKDAINSNVPKQS